jgi:tetratricopeptide (TPR) repeat protein
MVRARAFAERAATPQDFEKVVTELESALAAAPWWDRAYYNLAVAREKTKDYEGAIESLKLHLLADPRSSRAAAIKTM